MDSTDLPHFPKLTRRCMEVAELTAQGLTRNEIKNLLGISLATLKNHISAIYDSWRVSTSTGVAAALVHQLSAADRTERWNDVAGRAVRFAADLTEEERHLLDYWVVDRLGDITSRGLADSMHMSHSALKVRMAGILRKAEAAGLPGSKPVIVAVYVLYKSTPSSDVTG